MKKTINIICVAICCILVSCSSTDINWEPGPPISPDNMEAYFSNSNTTSYEFLQTDTDKGFELTVMRRKTSSAGNVPLRAVQGGDMFEIPASVSFASGEESKAITILYKGVDKGTVSQLVLALDESHFNPYNALGAGEIQLVASISDWEVLAENALFTATPNFKNFNKDIYYSPGTNQYKILDFLNSGVDFVYELDGIDIVPVMGQLSSPYWYLRDAAGNNYPVSLEPADEDNPAVLDYIYLYLAGYTTMNLETQSGRLYFYFYYTSGATAGWYPINFTW